MAEIAKRYQEQLKRIKKNVEEAHQYFKPNYDRYHEFRKFVFESSLSADEIALLKNLQKPQLEFNILEAYVSRLRGEFSKQEPSIRVTRSPGAGAQFNPAVVPVIEGHMRSILSDANNNSFEYEVYTDLLTGGFSVGRVWTEYANERSFDHVIKIGRVFDPTLCGFDPLARLPHKGDGQYCFTVYPKTRKEFAEEFPDVNFSELAFSRSMQGFSWSYRTNKDDILLVADYYEKKKKRVKIVQLSNGKVLTSDEYKDFLAAWDASGTIAQAPVIVGRTRMTEIETICRYRLIENQVIDYIETNYKYLPLVFIDGNSVLIRKTENGSVQQMTRPYVYHAKGVQKLKNFAGNTLANELENMVQHKWKVAKEGIPQEYTDAYTNNQIASLLIYNSYTDDEDPKPIPPPQEIARVPTPPEVTNAFSMSDSMTQTILGSYDASLGINDNQLSGIAIVEGATQSNAAAMPYVVGFLQGLNQIAQIIVDLIPKYYKGERIIPVVGIDGKRNDVPINQPGGVQFNYDSIALEVRVEAGVNFSIQKSRALQQIIALSQASPLFAQFINQEGLETLLDNLEIRGVDQLKVAAQQFMQKIQQQQVMQSQQPNPEMLKLQQEQQRLQIEAQQNQAENQLKMGEIANDAQANQNEKMKIMLEAQQAGMTNIVQAKKAQAETFSKAVDLALKTEDQQHRHTKEAVELAHQLSNSHQDNDGVTQND